MLTLISVLSRKQKSWIFLAVDLLLCPLALLFTFSVQTLPQSPFASFTALLPALPYVIAVTAGLSLWLGIPYVQLVAYERHAAGLTALVALATASAAALLDGVFGPGLPIGIYVVFGINYFLFMLSARAVLYRIVLAIYHRARPGCRVLIYGAGTTGTQLAQALKAHDEIDPVAFVDDNSSLQGMTLMGMPVFPPARIAEITSSREIKRVLLAMPSQSPPKQAQLTRRLQEMQLEVQVLPSFAQLIGEEALVDKLAPATPQSFLGRAARDVPLGAAGVSYQGRSVLVSGAGGSIGSELCRQVLACGPTRLVLYELSELALYTIHQELAGLGQDMGVEVVPVLGSVCDRRQMGMVLETHAVQVVLHAAAYKHVPLVETNPLPGLANNVLGAQALAQAADRAGVERFILISSDKAVRPASVMGASKRMAELVVQDLGSRSTGTVFATVRFGNVLGSSGSVVPLFQDQISRGGPVTVTDPNVKRYFMTIREAAHLVLQAGAEARGDEIFVLDMGEPVPILQLARQVIESAGYTVRDEDLPGGDIAIEITGLRPGEKLEEELTLSQELTTTRHAKIFCAREAGLSEIEVAAMLRALGQALNSNDEAAARQAITHWVEGYRQPEGDRRTS
ncbi:polysaccharide biosynthesis protein [Parasedimentitalea huanghaiensis]|uniref:NAD-dependent epimerase/dehydratase family protein n=1 Tax=Parasedimentitalea huanghaiensis TaxID=2682100 RepID=A0A6L6WMK4_9RHOB|nr:nucleoside-diphosphate sugar epimerase/dehydratase [Zongyanglinia huanghaiensis]MVO18540.1 NAD-dependent epimerase/dehydratase family protein [Zongyanglinia huanghaiensis]